VTGDPFDLERFVGAQDLVWDEVLRELRAGRKESHWMWFVFPQVEGLGYSSMSRKYAISGLAEARAYLAHPVLGRRLRECAELVVVAPAHSAQAMFGPIDALKLRSSMTLFARADPSAGLFGQVLGRFFNGIADSETEARLS